MLWFFCLVSGIVCAALAGAFYGYERGVKDTERRWSGDVERADYARKYESKG